MRCSQASSDIGESLAGTATTCGFLLVVEQPGPYAGRDAPVSSGFPPETGAALQEAVVARGGRLLLARRPGRHPHERIARRRVWLCRSDAAHTTAWTGDVSEPADLWQWVIPGYPDAPPVRTARPVTEPVLLVCTHGRRDACCARSGRTLLAPADLPIGEVWESSHQGGHRFAPVVLELTTGYQHGRVRPADLTAIAAAAARGEVHLPTARGRFALPPDEQAVDLAVRRELGLHAVDAIRIAASTGVIVAEDTLGRRFSATVTAEQIGRRSESCGADPVAAHNLHVELHPA